MQIHVVQRNETVATLAKQYRTTAADIIKTNDLPNPNNLVAGQAIVIPIVGSFYTVKQGDNLYSIARRFGVTRSSLLRLIGFQSISLSKLVFSFIFPKEKRQGGNLTVMLNQEGQQCLLHWKEVQEKLVRT